MDNPLDKPRTLENFMQDVEDLARDLAYGVSVGAWSARTFVYNYSFKSYGYSWSQEHVHRTEPQEKFFQKWIAPENGPTYDVLEAFGFMDRTSANEKQLLYVLTQKSLDLLQRPVQSPSIFISYRRKESSTFALLVEARLRMAGADPKRIFIDKTIPIGDEWESHLVERLTSCEVFICLVGKTAFKPGSWLQREIQILQAENPQAIILPILHNGVTLSSTMVQEFFGSRQSATVKEESALEYENAINHILNRLGYETYWPSPTSPFSGL
jgi:hypothetical protein